MHNKKKNIYFINNNIRCYLFICKLYTTINCLYVVMLVYLLLSYLIELFSSRFEKKKKQVFAVKLIKDYTR